MARWWLRRGRWLRGAGGRFAGSVGAGRDDVPTAAESAAVRRSRAAGSPDAADLSAVLAGYRAAHEAGLSGRLAADPGSVLEARIQWFDSPGGRDGEILARPRFGQSPEEFFHALTTDDHLAVVSWEAGLASGLVAGGARRVGVNVPNSVVSTADGRERLLAIAAGTENSVCFEFTEQTPLPEVPEMNALLDRLHAMGHTTALDDFGDGYHTDPAILEEYRFSKVKIARPFVMAAFVSGDPVGVLGPVLAGAQQRGQDVVVEGVDDPAKEQVLRDAGFTVFQSWLHHRPEPVVEVPATS